MAVGATSAAAARPSAPAPVVTTTASTWTILIVVMAPILSPVHAPRIDRAPRGAVREAEVVGVRDDAEEVRERRAPPHVPVVPPELPVLVLVHLDLVDLAHRHELVIVDPLHLDAVQDLEVPARERCGRGDPEGERVGQLTLLVPQMRADESLLLVGEDLAHRGARSAHAVAGVIVGSRSSSASGSTSSPSASSRIPCRCSPAIS